MVAGRASSTARIMQLVTRTWLVAVVVLAGTLCPSTPFFH